MKLVQEPDGSQWWYDHFIYRVGVASIAAGAQASDVIQIDQDSTFVWVKASYQVDLAGAAQTQSTRPVPLVAVSIQDGGSGRNLQNLPVPIGNIAGEGGLPLVLAVPREFKGGASILFTFDNYSAATAYDNVFISLIGYKKFLKSMPSQVVQAG